MKSKKECENIHAKSRIRERFGINMGKKLHQTFINSIQNGKAKFIRRQSNRVTVWQVEYNEDVLTLVYDKHRKQIITVFRS